MKKILIGLLLSAFLFNSAVVTSPKSLNAEEKHSYSESDRDIKTGYLLRENFVVYPAATSGWETKNMIRGVNLALGDVISLNTSIPTYIKKNFVSQKEEVVMDLTLALASDINFGYITLLGHKGNKETRGVLLSVENNVVKYVDQEGDKVELTTLSFDNDTGIRIIANASKNSASVEINGEALEEWTDLSLNEKVSDLSGIQIGFDEENTGGFKLKSLNIRKGYALYEDFETVGYVSKASPDYDFNKMNGVFVNATVNDHTTQNDNNSLAPLCFDDDDSTYWEHNKQYAITKNVYFMINYPQVVSVDTLKIKFASYYKGYLEFSICTPSGSWRAIHDAYRFVRFETTNENNYTIDVNLDVPQTFTILAIGFTVGDDGYDIPGGEIKISTINAFCKNPIEYDINTYPSHWAKQENTNSTVSIVSISNDKALQLNNDNGLKGCSVETPVNIEGDVTLEFTASFSKAKNGNRIGLVNQNNDFLGIETKDGKLQISITCNEKTQYFPIVNEEQHLDDLKTDLWNKFTFFIHKESNDIRLDYNGWTPIDGIILPESLKNSVWKKFIASTSTSKGTILLDSIQIYNSLEESNVPDIIPCDTGDITLSMQVCSLWREGSHTGWHLLDNEQSYHKQPILGYYDEGTPAVSDWEIKIAREHGISNMMFCWYRKGNGPIKTSNYSDAIWDGLFKSKFRDSMSFSLMLENASSNVINSYSDLIENIMPYFIETFFKNPNYQKTNDGKPILHIYIGDFSNSIGDANSDGKTNNLDVVFAINKMKEMCVEAGFPGLYVAAELRLPSATNTQKLESCGYDGIFSYTWASGYYNVSDDFTLSYSKNAIETQMNAANNMKVIPSLSKQWDPSAWMNCGFNPEGATYLYDLEHYRQFALYIKQIASVNPIDDSGTKMVMLDNWNEYSEGHYLMPTYGTPSYKDGHYAYGYLDLLREIFGIGEYEHVDYYPMEDGFGVYDTWYPMSWNEFVSKYLEEHGEVIDNSISETGYVDWEIGYNTCGGETIFVNDLEKLKDVQNANRIVISKQVCRSLKNSGGDLI